MKRSAQQFKCRRARRRVPAGWWWVDFSEPITTRSLNFQARHIQDTLLWMSPLVVDLQLWVTSVGLFSKSRSSGHLSDPEWQATLLLKSRSTGDDEVVGVTHQTTYGDVMATGRKTGRHLEL